jgi:hypothetical protein
MKIFFGFFTFAPQYAAFARFGLPSLFAKTCFEHDLQRALLSSALLSCVRG